MARSAAAEVKGFQSMNGGEQIVGVITNRVGGSGHYHIVQEAIEKECGIPVVGYIVNDQRLKLPERHLGLIPTIEQGYLDDHFEKLGTTIEETIDINHILQLVEKAEPPLIEDSSNLFLQKGDNCSIKGCYLSFLLRREFRSTTCKRSGNRILFPFEK
jgi:cobyrinic acid a,c-diamide synthase